MTPQDTKIRVLPGQIIAARLLIKWEGGDLSLIPPDVVETASFSLSEAYEPQRNQPLNKEFIQAAKFLTKYFGGKKHADPMLVAIARSKPGDPLTIPPAAD